MKEMKHTQRLRGSTAWKECCSAIRHLFALVGQYSRCFKYLVIFSIRTKWR